MLPLSLLLTPLVAKAAAQLPGPSWRKPSITTSLEDRISVAQGAISRAISQLDSTNFMFPDPTHSYPRSGTLYSQLAEFDQLTNQSRYAADLGGYYGSAKTVLDNMGAKNFSGFNVLNDGLTFGHGAAIAYKTYNVPIFLQYAKQSWWAAVPYTLTQTALDAGKIASKSFNLSSSCQGISMAGGVFWNKDVNNSDIVMIATGAFFILSAMLAEATADAMYLAAAVQSMSFIRSHLYNDQGLVRDGISARATDNCALDKVGLFAYDSGPMIEGLAVLYSVSQNTTYRDMLDELISAALKTNSWQNETGIIQNGVGHTGDMMIPRALVAAYSRNATSPSLRPSIRAYLAVQYNAVADLATQNNSNIYGAYWSGPAGTKFDTGYQTNAIQALISAFALDDPASPSSSGFSSQAPPRATNSISPGPTPPPKAKASVGAIVGAIVGGIIALCLLGLLLLRWRRKRRDMRQLTMPFPNSALDIKDASAGDGHSPSRPAAPNPKRRILPVRRAPSQSPSSESWAAPPPTPASGEARADLQELSPWPLSVKQRSVSVVAVGRGQPELTTEELLRMLYNRMNGANTSMRVVDEEALPEYRTA
ncbi:Glycoside hydrolase family 76 protein [Mycena indigotica]|uniref:Glycoside hydrolase family 76 protein n=1 Tax=Mycena indigotica TaxID=2126181 RepID=A0A8H6RXZ2_9AGAR|nr:Glycoside hydrolase family 76 protein [Mycena indigotica]KAF7288743.1 Glycoside hydrolase family 76 protein [Mycena indigotica]